MAIRDINGGRHTYRFGKVEKRDLLISSVVLAVAFALLFRNSSSIKNYFVYYVGSSWVVWMFITMFILVILSFVLHELGHKFTAQKLGFWSEYRMYPAGLVLSLVMSIVGFLIAAPGVTMIRGNVSKDDNGRISIAGPMVNIVLAAIGLVGVLLTNHTAAVLPFYLLFMLNASLALFNLIPIPPLDGSKVLSWKPAVWIACIAIAALEFASIYMLPTLYFA